MNNKIIQYNKGAALILFIIFFLASSTALTYLISRSIFSDLLTYRLLADSKQSYLAADSGVEDTAYRFIASLTPSAVEVITIANAHATTTNTYDSINDVHTISTDAEDNDASRSSEILLYVGSGASFNFGVQTGNGGFEMSNGSSVIGNVFSNGTIKKVAGGIATIYGDVISAGSSGLIIDIHATGSAWAHVIRDSIIDMDAYAYTLDNGDIFGDAEYFEIINGTTVWGTSTSGVVLDNQAPSVMPISDPDIEAMKQDILTNGTIYASTSPECISGTYFIDTDTTLGMSQINCNLTLKKQGPQTILTLEGPLWVVGDIKFEAGPTITAASSIGNRTVYIIADDENNRTTGSTITIENGTEFNGSGDPKSYVLVLSQNNDAENGGAAGADAILLGQSSEGDLLVYAAHGKITMGNSVSLNEVTGYLISLGNSASIIYESGLVNLLFTTGPGGGFTIGGWGETE